MSVTYFVALPFFATEDGELVAGQAEECQSPGQAIRRAQAMAATAAGAAAFSRTGDPSSGEFGDAEVIASFGTVPSIEELLAAD